MKKENKKETPEKVCWYRSILFKQGVVMLLILCPITMLFLNFYHIYQDEAKAKIQQMYIQHDQEIFEEMLTDLDRMQYSIYHLFSSDEIGRFLAFGNEQKKGIECLADVQERLEWITTEQEYVQNLCLYFWDKEILVFPRVHRPATTVEFDVMREKLEKNIQMEWNGTGLNIYKAAPFHQEYALLGQVKEEWVDHKIQAIREMGDSTTFLLVNDQLCIGDSEWWNLYTNANSVSQSIAENENARIDCTVKVLNHGKKQYQTLELCENYYNLKIVSIRDLNSVFAQSRQHLWVLYCAFGINVLVVIGFVAYMYLYVKRPLVILSKAFRELGEGKNTVISCYPDGDEFGVLYTGFNKTNHLLQEYIDKTYVQKIQLQKMQLKQLQSQIKPHFLYNTLFMLKARVRCKDYSGAMELAELLGEYYQYLTRDKREIITLQEEVEHAFVYIQIQKKRFGERFSLEWEDCPEPCRNIQIPRLVLQPLVENSLKYGLENVEENGALRFSYHLYDDKLQIHLEDSGVNVSDEKLHEMNESLQRVGGVQEVTGTLNIHGRLRLFYGSEYGLHFERSALGGVKVVVILKRK